MKIRNNTPQINRNFKAIPIAKIKTKVNGIQNEIELYQLHKSDLQFGYKLLESLKLKQLIPGERKQINLYILRNIIKDAVIGIADRDNVVLAVQNKKPCGIISYIKLSPEEYYVNDLATWPIARDKKVPFAGQALLNCLFRNALTSNIKKITLTPSDGTIKGKSCVNFYKKFGFYNDGFLMNFDSSQIELSRRIAQIENNMRYKEIKNSHNINLNRNLSLKFSKSYLEKLIEKIKHKLKK